jgi:hypothetical protein
MRRSTANLSRQAQALFDSKIEFTCEDEDSSKRKPGVLYVKHRWLRQANLAALLIGFIFVISYLCGGFSGSASGSVPVPAPTVRRTVSNNAIARNKYAPTTIQPLVCTGFLQEVKSGSYSVLTNVNDPNKKETFRVPVRDPNEKKGHFSRRTTTEFPFQIALHHEKFDPRRWNIYKHGQYYQHALEHIWTDILNEASPGARVIDIG